MKRVGLKKLLLILSFLPLLSLADETGYNWTQVKGFEDGLKVYLAYETVDKESDSGFVSYFTKVTIPISYSEEMEGVSSFIAYRMGNCEQRMKVNIAVQYYGIVSGEESIIKTVETKEDWQSVDQDSWSVLDEVCSL